MADAVIHPSGTQPPAPGPHGAHAHPAHLQHHFDTPAQQFDAGKLGMWIFLATEVLFFSGLFCAYAIYRHNHPEVFAVAHKHLSIFWGAVNTVVLIVSSFTMALGVYFAQTSRRGPLVVCLLLTLLGAVGFMCIKAVEYTDKWKHGTLWGHHYHPHDDHGPAAAQAHSPAPHAAADAGRTGGSSGSLPASGAHVPGPPAGAHDDAGAAPASPAAAVPEVSLIKRPGDPPAGLRAAAAEGAHLGPSDEEVKNVHLFFGIYFCLTGLHGLHVLAGMVVITWLLIGAIGGRYSAEYYTPVDLGGLYWHLVDLIWIYLFPLLYLIH